MTNELVLPEAQRTLTFAYEVRGVKGKPNAILATGRASNHENFYPVTDRAGVFQERTHYPVLKNADTSGCVLLFGHEGMPYGSVKGGNLQVNETTKGIEWECQLDARSQAHNDLAVLLERGDASQGSVGMKVGKDEWSSNFQQRDIYSLSHLYDVTITPNGCNPETESSLRDSQRDAEYARIFAMAEQETRAGAVHSMATKSALQAMLDDHKKGTKKLHQGMVNHINTLLAGALPQGGTLQDGTTAGGGGQNGWNQPGAVNSDATGSRHLTAAQRSLLALHAERLADEELEDWVQRTTVQEVLEELRHEGRHRWTRQEKQQRAATRAEAEVRKTFAQADLVKLHATGHALKTADGHIGFPIRPGSTKDLQNAISAAPLSTKWPQSTVRAHIIKAWKSQGSPKDLPVMPSWLK